MNYLKITRFRVIFEKIQIGYFGTIMGPSRLLFGTFFRSKLKSS